MQGADSGNGVSWGVLDFALSLETRGFQVFLVNAQHVKNVSGRKRDVSDCQWIQYLHSVGLLRASLRPPVAHAHTYGGRLRTMAQITQILAVPRPFHQPRPLRQFAPGISLEVEKHNSLWMCLFSEINCSAIRIPPPVEIRALQLTTTAIRLHPVCSRSLKSSTGSIWIFSPERTSFEVRQELSCYCGRILVGGRLSVAASC